MLTDRKGWLAALALTTLWIGSANPTGAQSSVGAAGARPIRIVLDATEAPRRILHAHLVIPAATGPLTLYYPKWIPGEHGPSGPIADLAGLRLSAGGKPVPWARDSLDMFAFHCTVPAGVDAIEAELDFLDTEGGSSNNLTIVTWHQVLLYPDTPEAMELPVAASLRLPSGWKHASALPSTTRESDGTIEFEPAPLATLIDSPAIAGLHFRSIPLEAPGPQPHAIDIVCDSPEGLAMKPADVVSYTKLVAETDALFGARHYRRYHFLVALSDAIDHGGIEHHESSHDRAPERLFVDGSVRTSNIDLLPHEIVHSWNGKYRRPAGLVQPNFQVPIHSELLWIYEGLTQYLGFVLVARSGLQSPQEAKEVLALVAAGQESRVGRAWRPLVDTAVAAQLLYGGSRAWRAWRRGLDFYNDGILIWLEADATIREITRGRHSLDDFCRRFFGGKSGPPEVVPYTLEDVIAGLDAIAPHDWRRFFDERVDRPAREAPLGGLAASGWHLDYGDSASDVLEAWQSADEYIDHRWSIGLLLDDEGGVTDVVPDLAAAKAGMAPGMKLVAVNGRKWSARALREALTAGKRGTEPLELLAENGDFVRTFRLDYHGGERYPGLVRDPGRADLLARILSPLSPRMGRKRGR